jgi:hypothetical protein
MSVRSCAINFPDGATRRLYERAREEQWRVHEDVHWNSLTLDAVAGSVRQAMGEIYAQIHHAEIFGLRTCGLLLDAAASDWSRQLLTTQVLDETRHVEFFARVLVRLEAEGRAGDPIRALADEISGMHAVEDLLVGMLVLETAAHAVFVAGGRQSQRILDGAIRVPGNAGVAELLTTIVRLIGRDESRHIALGLRCLAERAASLLYRRRAALELRAAAWCVQVQQLLGSLRSPLLRLGLVPTDLQSRIWTMQRHNLKLAGIEIGPPPIGSGSERAA